MRPILENPAITHIMAHGYPRGYDMPICPICGEEVNEFFMKDRDIVGCECCIERHFDDEGEAFYMRRDIRIGDDGDVKEINAWEYERERERNDRECAMERRYEE